MLDGINASFLEGFFLASVGDAKIEVWQFPSSCFSPSDWIRQLANVNFAADGRSFSDGFQHDDGIR
ncbi:MAG: hypothetical protein MZW92_31530 [Comamonadaceae bacterium]|nr:hypothetical protein [Comamonadaceae bacterium]